LRSPIALRVMNGSGAEIVRYDTLIVGSAAPPRHRVLAPVEVGESACSSLTHPVLRVRGIARFTRSTWPVASAVSTREAASHRRAACSPARRQSRALAGPAPRIVPQLGRARVALEVVLAVGDEACLVDCRDGVGPILKDQFAPPTGRDRDAEGVQMPREDRESSG